jgi:uncharacterized membrane protein
MIVVPKIDPKRKYEQMGVLSIEIYMVLFMSMLAFIILHLTKPICFKSEFDCHSARNTFFIALGNYFKVIQPNYFIGIKTPWTLESKEVWKLACNGLG